jgi:hypothetical protein
MDQEELNDVYADLLGAHVLATIRESWAVGRGLTHLRIIGIRQEADRPIETLFDIDVARGEGRWDDDRWGSVALQHATHGLYRTGRTRDVQPWPRQQQRPDTHDLVVRPASAPST